MHNIVLIARREFQEQIRSRAFRLSTILVPVAFVVFIGIIYMANRGTSSAKRLVIASTDPVLATAIRSELLSDKDAGSMSIEAMPSAKAADRIGLVERVSAKAIDGFMWIDTDKGIDATYVGQSSGDFITAGRLDNALNKALVRERLTTSGVKPGEIDSLLKKVELETAQVDNQGREVKSNAMTSFYKGYLMAIMLTMTTMIYGMNVARSIIQEKTSRIFEVMLAIARPSDMLAGKLVGAGAVGLTQIAIWGVAGAAIMSYPAAVAVLSGKFSLQFSWVEGVLFPLYFVLGYLLNAALFAGLAASCETEQELQMYAPLAALPVWLSFGLIVIVVNNPNSLLSIAASLFPATAPIIMMLRMGSQMPPAWQFAASIGIMIVSIWATLWVSSRLYRVGILMHGKRATLPELLRWLRYS